MLRLSFFLLLVGEEPARPCVFFSYYREDFFLSADNYDSYQLKATSMENVELQNA